MNKQITVRELIRVRKILVNDKTIVFGIPGQIEFTDLLTFYNSARQLYLAKSITMKTNVTMIKDPMILEFLMQAANTITHFTLETNAAYSIPEIFNPENSMQTHQELARYALNSQLTKMTHKIKRGDRSVLDEDITHLLTDQPILGICMYCQTEFNSDRRSHRSSNVLDSNMLIKEDLVPVPNIIDDTDVDGELEADSSDDEDYELNDYNIMMFDWKIWKKYKRGAAFVTDKILFRHLCTAFKFARGSRFDKWYEMYTSGKSKATVSDGYLFITFDCDHGS